MEGKQQPAQDSGAVNRIDFAVGLSEAVGRCFHYYVTSDVGELNDIEGFAGQAGICLVQPDEYGIKGVVKYQWPGDGDFSAVSKELGEFAKNLTKAAKFHRRHVIQGREAGRIWETEVPVTDPQAIRAQRAGGAR